MKRAALRLATDTDTLAAAAVITCALDDLSRRQNRPPSTGDAVDNEPCLKHCLQCSPGRVWVAEADGAIVGIGAGLERGALRFLAALFVLPEWQGLGIGRALAERAMAAEPGSAGLAAVLSSGANVVSNRLYAQLGMFPVMPALCLTGRVPAQSRLPALGSLRAAPVSPADLVDLREIDVFATGIDRTADHRWMLGAAGRPGWVFRRRGRVAGYAFLGGDGSEGSSFVGPLAARRPGDVAAVLAYALLERGEGQRATVLVPGANQRAQRLLWGAGFELAGPAGLLGVSRPFGRFDRYLFAGNGLM